MNQQKYYYSIDLAKLICAILVIAIHSTPFGTSDFYSIPNYVIKDYISRIAVPFFFVSSGFFFFQNYKYDDNDVEKVKKYVFRLLFLYIIWCLIYIPFRIDYIINNPNGQLLGPLLYIKVCIFDGGYIHLWYLRSLAVSIMIISFLLRKNIRIETIVVSAVIFYCIGCIGQGYSFILKPLKNYNTIYNLIILIKKIIGTTRNGIFEGFIFVTIGFIMATKK